MKFGVREICDVVLKAKANQKIGNKQFYKNEPVIYFDTLKTSSMEGAATTVYAQGGRGNTNLVAWEGERTVTFTMEDALISPEGFMILSGAGLVEGSTDSKIKQHVTQTVDKDTIAKIDSNKVDTIGTTGLTIPLSYNPYIKEDDTKYANDNTVKDEDYVYVFFMKDGNIISEPYIAHKGAHTEGSYSITIEPTFKRNETEANKKINDGSYKAADLKTDYTDCDSVMVDYYTERGKGAKQIEITADKFGGNYYLEASTLFRNQDGVDMPAEFIIPNCKIQSNFNFTMASSGDPSTFTFTMDAFPDYTRFDHSKKVLAAIQIIEESEESDNGIRMSTAADKAVATTPSPGTGD